MFYAADASEREGGPAYLCFYSSVEYVSPHKPISVKMDWIR